MSCDVGETTKSLKNEQMSCDVGEATESLKNEQMTCDVGEATESLKNEQSSFSKLSVASPTSQFILQLVRRFTYVTGHSPTLLLLHLHHSSFSNPSFASPTSQDFHLRHLASRPCTVNIHFHFVASLYVLAKLTHGPDNALVSLR